MAITGNIVISFSEGNVIRNYFQQGLLEELQQAGFRIVFFTPAATVPDFVESYWRKNIEVFPLHYYSPSTWESRAERIRKKLEKISSGTGRWFKGLEYSFYSNLEYYSQKIQEIEPVFMLFTNPMYRHEIPLFMAAKKLGLKNAGLLRSWDNLHMGLKFFPDKLLVWNEVNAKEAVGMMGYKREQVEIIGPCQMDPYFKAENIWTREAFCKRMHLDPTRPILTLATIGKLVQGYDENYIADQLVQLIESKQIPGDPQLIIRLHPVSRYEEFLCYQKLTFVRISHVKGHIPTLGWTMSQEEVIEVASLLRHTDALISPGSTITIEAAVFDTPTIFPVYHHYQPGLGNHFYNTILKKHHKRLRELDLVPFVEKKEDFLPAILKCLKEPDWYSSKRKMLASEYVCIPDGRSTNRLVKFLTENASC